MDYSFPGISYLFIVFTLISPLFCPTCSPAHTLGIHLTDHDRSTSSRLMFSQSNEYKSSHISKKSEWGIPTPIVQLSLTTRSQPQLKIPDMALSYTQYLFCPNYCLPSSSCSTTDGSARVLVSPNSVAPEATLTSIRRIILPLLVLGNASTNWISYGVAIIHHNCVQN